MELPLPLFDRQQAGRQRAAAEAQQARAEYRLVRTRAEGELSGLTRQAEALRTAAVDYRSHTLAASRSCCVSPRRLIAAANPVCWNYWMPTGARWKAKPPRSNWRSGRVKPALNMT